MATPPLLEIHNLHYTRNKTPILRGVSFCIERGETFGLVGESGSGKTTLAKLLLSLLPLTSGKIFYEGRNVQLLSRQEEKTMRTKMQMVFQNPYSSLNPRLKVETIIEEPLIISKHTPKIARKEEVFSLLEKVGLSSDTAKKYPHELSGGQRQRVAIARALILRPPFLLLDEPVAALDVSIQAQIINLLNSLQEEFHLTYLFISHDLALVRYFSDRVAVLYQGEIVELSASEKLYTSPKHSYTQQLLSSHLFY